MLQRSCPSTAEGVEDAAGRTCNPQLRRLVAVLRGEERRGCRALKGTALPKPTGPWPRRCRGDNTASPARPGLPGVLTPVSESRGSFSHGARAFAQRRRVSSTPVYI